MIRHHGVEILQGQSRRAVFDAALLKANWPSVAGVRIGPEGDVLTDGGRVRAELQLPGLLLAVSGEVTTFRPGSLIEAAGHQYGMSATMAVEFADNAADLGDEQVLTTTMTWRFDARLPTWMALFELPAAAAIAAAIPTLRTRFINNIERHIQQRPDEVARPAPEG